MSDLDSFRVEVAGWLRDNKQHAPRNYGAIVPPELVDEGVAWQRRLYDAGMTGFHRVADLDDVSLYTRGRALQALGQRQGTVATTAASLLKLGITELFFDIAVARADAAVAHAMLDNDASLGVLGAPGGRIAGGSSQVQRNIIGELLLGLPKEPRPH